MCKLNYMIEQISKNSYKLCCRNGCPTITFENQKVNIKDDFGGEVKMTLEEAEMLTTAISLWKSSKSE